MHSPGQDGTSAVSAADSSSHVAGLMPAKGDGENHSWIGDLEIKRFQSEDQNCKLMVEMKTGGDRKPLPAGYSPTLRSLWSQWSRIIVQNGVLYRRWEEIEGQNSFLQVVVPRSLVNKVLEALYCDKTAGHLGFEKTLTKVRSRFYWYGYQKDTEIFCKKCDRCAAGKSPPYTTNAPLQLDIPTYPWERIAMDIVGPLPKTDRNNRYILVISDYFTKWPEGFALPDHRAETIAEKLVDDVICRHGVLRTIHTDQGKDFDSKLIKALCELLEIEKTRTTAYHPESDGLVERLNKTLITMIRSLVDEEQKTWDIILPKVLLGYRSSVQSTTGYSPFYLMGQR